jgi:serine/threonine protein phosphatase PrpC
MWRIIGASVPGKSHIVTGRGCDDANDFSILRDGTMLAAVADGAGSAAYSMLGARFCVRTVLRIARTKLTNIGPATSDTQWADIATETLSGVVSGMKILSGRTGYPLAELACTLIFAIFRPDRGIVVQVGDGAAVIQDEMGNFDALSKPDHGQYVNETVFVTSKDAVERAQLTLRSSPVKGLALFTDGLERLALDVTNWQPHEPFFAPLFEFASSRNSSRMALEEFLRSDRVNSLTDDDKTLVLATR